MQAGYFTERVVAELAPHVPPLAHCRAALLEGMTLAAPPGSPAGVIETPRAVAVRCAVAALHADGRSGGASRVRAPRRALHRVTVPAGGPATSDGRCCRRSRLRGAFLAIGSVSRPERPPHLEIAVRDEAAAAQLLEDWAVLEVEATVRDRRGRTLVTVRTAAAVGAALSSIGASAARLSFEQGRVVRDVRAGVNRSLNAETANLLRVVDAAVRQARAARRLREDAARWDRLPEAIREAAELRSANPTGSIQTLAERAGISRGAMAGRLHRMMHAAEP